jgi:hypothetical protein
VKSYIPISTYVRINKLKCAGQVTKMEVYSPSKEILRRSFGEKRPVGRSRSRWEYKVQKDAVSLLHIRNRKPVVLNRIGLRKIRGAGGWP